MTGVVTAAREAAMRLLVFGEDERRIEVEAILDTGFDGGLTLSADAVDALSLPLRGSRESILADGSLVALDIHRARVLWEGHPRVVQILAAEGAPLVGMSLLYGSEVRLRVVEGGSVVIEPL